MNMQSLLEQCTPFTSSDLSQQWHQQKGVHILGFTFDGTACFRPGQRFAPNALREASTNLETYSPYLNLDLEDMSVWDLGNISAPPNNWPLLQDQFNQLKKHLNITSQTKLLSIGGEHSISYLPISHHLETYKDLVLIHLDAHADLRDGYLGHTYSHASIIRRVHDHFTSSNELLQYGIRSGTKDEFNWMNQHNSLCKSLDELLERIESLDQKRPIYLTLDLDFIDPAYFPGTGTPEPGGENFHNLMKIIKILGQRNLVGADATELCPVADSSGNSNCFAAKVVRELLLALN